MSFYSVPQAEKFDTFRDTGTALLTIVGAPTDSFSLNGQTYFTASYGGNKLYALDEAVYSATEVKSGFEAPGRYAYNKFCWAGDRLLCRSVDETTGYNAVYQINTETWEASKVLSIYRYISGICADSSYIYILWSDKIRKYSISDLSLVAVSAGFAPYGGAQDMLLIGDTLWIYGLIGQMYSCSKTLVITPRGDSAVLGGAWTTWPGSFVCNNEIILNKYGNVGYFAFNIESYAYRTITEVPTRKATIEHTASGKVYAVKADASPENQRTIELGGTAPTLVAEDPVLSPASGYSAGPITVAVTCATPTAVLHYTVDGSTPTESSPVLNGGIRLGSWISPAITLKVLAVSEGHKPSAVVSATYQFTAQAPMASLQMQPETGYFFSEANSRKPRSFGACGKSIFKGTIQWDLIDDEWPMFLEWWEAKAKGVAAFDVYCCTGAATALHTFQAVGPYSVVTETGLRKVTLPVKLTNRPTGLVEGWGDALLGPPAGYPLLLLPMPQWGYQGEEAAMFLSTSGMPAAARPVATRGETLAFEWKGLTGAEFDVLVDWWASILGRGRRKFQLALPNREDTLLCQLVEDPLFAVEGVYFSGSMKVFAAKVRTLAPLPS